ncbi:Protein bir1 [Yarrowia sp. C11]|nr:Protein bir1 [Yarrowia sp. E02]KAG5369882.1 Protein bir1 [Yarrowia sp. C11]
MVAYTERLASFEDARLPRRKKKVQWPHEHPDPEQLAKAGFYFNPRIDSPDNVTCFLCECSLDGWELDDCPLREHLEHSRGCSWATILSKDWQKEKNHDPHCKENIGMRLTTFDSKWPLEKKRGWPTSLKLAEAGFYFAPTVAEEDLVVCAYCDISLDGWERTDDPLHEHERRRPECYFFTSMKKETTKKKRKSSKRVSKKIEEVVNEVADESVVIVQQSGNDSVQILSEEEPASKPIRSKKEGRRPSAKTAPKIRQVSVEEELAKLQKEMEDDGEISVAVEQPEEHGESDYEVDLELNAMAKQADEVVHNLDDGISDEGISDEEVVEEPQPEPTPVRSNKRPSNVINDAEPAPPAKRQKSTATPAAPVTRLSLAISEDTNNWEVFSGSSSPSSHYHHDEDHHDEDHHDEENDDEDDDNEEEEDDDRFVEAKENLSDDCVMVSPPHATEEEVPAQNIPTEVKTETEVPVEEQEEQPVAKQEEKEEPVEENTEPKNTTDTSDTSSEPRGRDFERRSRAITRSPLAVRNLNLIVNTKSNTSTPQRPKSSPTLQWEPVDCDQVFDVCEPSPHKEADHILDMTITDWYKYQSVEAEKRLMEKCNRMVEVVQREGQRALNHIKALPTVDG